MSQNIENDCHFITKRLEVLSWVHQNDTIELKGAFEEKVRAILSPEVTRFLPEGWQELQSNDDVREWIKERDNESLFLTIQLQETQEVIGFLFLFGEARIEGIDMRFGYLLSELFWEQGLGTELLKGLVKWCQKQDNISKLSGGVEKDNVGSIKALERVGFKTKMEKNTPESMVFYTLNF